jgi:hypothetical protein
MLKYNSSPWIWVGPDIHLRTEKDKVSEMLRTFLIMYYGRNQKLSNPECNTLLSELFTRDSGYFVDDVNCHRQ